MNSAMTRVASSSMRYRMTSVIDTIDSLPIDTRRLTPTLRDWAKVSTELASAAALQHHADRAAAAAACRWAGRTG